VPDVLERLQRDKLFLAPTTVTTTLIQRQQRNCLASTPENAQYEAIKQEVEARAHANCHPLVSATRDR
jgi:hypothetical protein